MEFPEPPILHTNAAVVKSARADPRPSAAAHTPAASPRAHAQPRTGNCWHGLYFDVEALGAGVTVTGLRTARSAGARAQESAKERGGVKRKKGLREADAD